MTQQELEEEPVDVFETNIMIMGIERRIINERAKRQERERERNIRHEV